MSEEQAYILGTHQAELDRLGFQHRVWADAAHALWHKAQFKGGQRLLDLGCGPGFATMDLAQLVGRKGHVTGVDRSEVYIEFAKEVARNGRTEHIDLICSEFDAMNLKQGNFDGAYSRWVFSWITDVEDTIQKVAHSLRSGGVFALQEYIQWSTFQVLPEQPDVRVMIEACRTSWKQMDGQIDIGARLPELLRKHGFRIQHLAPLERTARPGDTTWQWPTGFLSIYGRQLVDLGLLTLQQVEAYEHVLPSLEADPTAFLVTPLMVEIIAVKD